MAAVERLDVGDEIEAADGAPDVVLCGDDTDRAWRDAADDVELCEFVTTGPRSIQPSPTPTPAPTARPTPTPTPKVSIDDHACHRRRSTARRPPRRSCASPAAPARPRCAAAGSA
jgi:hypothetical protein